MKIELELSGVHKQTGDPYSTKITLNEPKDGIWKAKEASAVTATGGGSDNSKWAWNKTDSSVKLYELGYTPTEPELHVVLSGVERFPMKVDDAGTGVQKSRGVKLKVGDISWKCLNVR